MNTKKTINDSRLIALLKALSNREMKALSEFVASPFFNKKEKVRDLLSYLKKRHPDFPSLYRTQLYQHVFSENNIISGAELDGKQDQQLRYAMSDLAKLVEKYLLYEKQAENTVREKYQLAEVFLSRNLGKYVPELLRIAEKKQAERPEGEPTYMHDKYLLSETRLRYQLTIDHIKNVGMQMAIDNFQHHALVGQLRLYVAAISREHSMPGTYNYPMSRELLEHLATNDYTHVPIVDAYYRIFMLFRGEDVDTHYTRLRRILMEQNSYFSHSELRYLYTFLLNFCNLHINRGNLEYNKEKFLVYERTLSENIWQGGKYISQDHFILAVRAALEIKNVSAAKYIIETYNKDLPPPKKRPDRPTIEYPITHLAYTFLFVAEEKYEEAEVYLIKMGGPPEGFYYGIYFRLLCTQIYYELSISPQKHYRKLLKADIENLQSYLRYAPMSARNKELYTNYLKIIKRIYNMRFNKINPPSQKVLEKIKYDIEDPNLLLVAREWLLKKINELIEYWNKKR